MVILSLPDWVIQAGLPKGGPVNQITLQDIFIGCVGFRFLLLSLIVLRKPGNNYGICLNFFGLQHSNLSGCC